jgi:hypothetical protein
VSRLAAAAAVAWVLILFGVLLPLGICLGQ